MDRFGTQGRGISSGQLIARMGKQDRIAREAATKRPSDIRIAQLQVHAQSENCSPEVRSAARAKLAALGIEVQPLRKRSYRYGDPR